MNDPISELLASIRNASRAMIKVVELPHSNLKESIARLLRDEGFLTETSVKSVEGRKVLRLVLRYNGKRCAIEGLQRISRLGARRYSSASKIPRLRNGLGKTIVTTSQGVLIGDEARRRNLGGEVLCAVW
jgi:small subunit ribosomal protein S8